MRTEIEDLILHDDQSVNAKGFYVSKDPYPF